MMMFKMMMMMIMSSYHCVISRSHTDHARVATALSVHDDMMMMMMTNR